jgi:hypothetical protein
MTDVFGDGNVILGMPASTHIVMCYHSPEAWIIIGTIVRTSDVTSSAL